MSNLSKIRRYKLLSGPHAGEVFDGADIGVQDYPDQFVKEKLTHDQILSKLTQEDLDFLGINLSE